MAKWHRQLAAGAAVMAATLAVAALADVDRPVIVKGKGERCVEPTEVMRSDHMRFLFHQRDETVIKGVRTKRHSLKQCVHCHATQDEAGRYIPINAEGQFCQSCHEYASVKIDCFDCHATRPAGAD